VLRGRGPVEIRSVSDNRVLASLPASTDLPAYHGTWSSNRRFLAVQRDQQNDGHRSTLEVWDVPPPGADFQTAIPADSSRLAPGEGNRKTRYAKDDEGAASAQTGSRRADAQPVLVVPDLRWHAVSFHPRLPRIMAGRQGGVITIQDLVEEREVARFKLAPEVIDLGFSPDGERFATLCRFGGDAILSVHDATTGSVLTSNQFSDFALRAGIAWHPDGSWIAIVDGQGTAYLMDSRSGEKRTLGQHKAQAVIVVFSPDGGYLFTGSWEHELICWDTRTMRRAFTIALDADDLQFDSGGNRCALYVRGGPVKLHAFERPGPREFSEDLGPRLLYATFSPDGRWLGAAADKRGGVWDLSGAGPANLDDEARGAQFFFTPDGREVFGSRKKDSDGTHCFRWQLPPATNSGEEPELTRLPMWEPEGFKFLTWFSNSVVMTGAKGSQVLAPAEFESGSDRWTKTASGMNGVSADGQWLAINPHFSPSLSVYRLPGLESVARLTHPANIYSFEFSPRGDELAVGSRWGMEFWNTSTWQRTRAVAGFRDIVYTPDAATFWLTKDAFTAGLYDARTVEPLLPLPNGTLPLALSANGRHLAVSVDQRRLQVWDLAAVRHQLRDLGLDWDDKPAGLTPGK
jgi:WD40 repeat protein